ncbi:MAG: N-acetylmuramoyl-L-alanine amidase [Endomicrobium sp.]|jgi:N-acetylmuramoyl-L-alanine amidase|nr:N-acetylmuramoyl-L-alanine amidase [Endomicrobium sp.]
MKKIISLFFSAGMSFFFAFSYAAADKFLLSQNVNAVLDGSLFRGISAYKVSDDTYYFSVKELAELYNAVLEWRSVSSKVTMRLNNRKIDIRANSSEVFFGRKSKKMSLPSRFIKSDVYVPPEIITSKEFAEIADAETSWNPSSLVLTVTRHANISAVRYFTKSKSTQVRVQLDASLHYRVSKNADAITLTILRGKVQNGSINVNNGVIKDIRYGTVGCSAVVTISLEQVPKNIKTTSSSKPAEIFVEIEHSRKVPVIVPKEDGVDEVKEGRALTGKSLDDLDLTPPEKFGQSQISEFDRLAENDEENKDLKGALVTTFESDKIIDDSFIIVDDTDAISGVVSKKENKKKKFARKKIVVIDAGHGGEDSGAVGANGTKEKDLNLDIAYELKSIFDKDDDFEIILTRKGDTFIPLAERANIANEHNADLFISIHCNANLDRNASGFEIYFLSEKATNSEAAATAVLENSVLELEGKPSKKRAMLQEMLWAMTMTEYMNESSELSALISSQASGRLMIPSRGVKQASFYVLRGAQMPSVLVESAFLSNYSEEAKLGTKNFRASVADSIYEGIIRYYAKKERDQNSKK